MSAEFWQLPGPSRYIERIRHDLLDCKNALTILSPLTPDGLYDELRRGIDAGGSGFYWQQMYEPPPEDRPPAVWLASSFGVDLPTSAGACEFHDVQEAMGTVVVVTEMVIAPTSLRRWITFIEQYAQVCRSVGNAMSPRFLIQWPLDCKLPESDLRLALHHWDGTVDSTDIGLYAALKLRRKGHTPFNRQMMTALAAKLSGGDPILCRDLCNRSLLELLDSLPILAGYARVKGWDDATPLSINDGTLIILDGEQREHPAWMAIRGKVKEIGILVWSAQIGIIMPLIEERRGEVVDKYSQYLNLPDTDKNKKTIESVMELEIGQIQFQLNNTSNPVPRPVKDVVFRLWILRNYLSHRTPIPAFKLDEQSIRALTQSI